MAGLWLDGVALAFFIAAWSAYHALLESRRFGGTSLNALMHQYRRAWMDQMLHRNVRIIDTQIMASLQNGTAFFASTSLLVIGGSLALLRATHDVLQLFEDLPLAVPANRALWEMKVLGEKAAHFHVQRTGDVITDAGRQFNRGQRAFFFALAYAAWFVSPWAFITATIAVLIAMVLRQFRSPSRAAVLALSHGRAAVERD